MPAIEVTLTMRPYFCLIIGRRAARLTLNTLLRFCARTASQSSSFMAARRPSRVVPALLTRTSRRPKRSTASFTTAWASANRLTSPRTAPAVPPPPPIPPTTSAAAPALLREFRATGAPAGARRRAHARPIPRDAPVTRATLPVRLATAIRRRPLRAPAEEAEEVAALAEPPAHELAVAQHGRAEGDHLPRAAVEAPIEDVHPPQHLPP